MTLHWWMHWFWITGIILGSGWVITAAPQSEELQHITTDTGTDTIDQNQNERRPKAMYYTKSTPLLPTSSDAAAAGATEPSATILISAHTESSSESHVSAESYKDFLNSAKVRAPSSVEPPDLNSTQQHWTPANTSVGTLTTPTTLISHQVNESIANMTQVQNTTVLISKKRINFTSPKNQTASKEVEDSEIISDSKIVTSKPLSQETPRFPAIVSEVQKGPDDLEEGRMDTGAVAGVSFAALALAALAGSTVFVLWRRRYLNKPQTLNDKCSNPDSSGYLDDSTIRENSEEMYSLDNDSFLNSLEAMTIQNYWTDTVKHTKL